MTYQEFSSVLKRKPDEEQEKVIRSLKNTIVSAGAGSGKTQTLASRFVYLITADLKDEAGNKMENPTVDKILTLTFTKKAAAEMYQRIYKTLKIFAEQSLDADGRQKAQNAIDNFSKSRIQTLDSYSASVLRQAAPLYGIRPDFAPGADASQTKDLAFSFVMEKRNDPAIQWISDPAKIENCAEFFSSAANENASLADSANPSGKCSFFSESLRKQKQAAQGIWDSQNLFFAIEDCIEKISASVAAAQKKGRMDWRAKLLDALAFWEQDSVKEERKKLKSLGPEKIAKADGKALLKKAVEKFKISNKIGDPETNDLVNGFLFGQNGKGPGAAEKFFGIIDFFGDLEYLESLHSLLDEFTDRVNDNKRKSGALTFKDTNEMALLALKEQEAIRRQERDSFEFIMIDEFQDNNAANRELLLLISKDDKGRLLGDRLFFVGDEKQSIYKFRGADVSVFNSLEEYIKPCVKLPMRSNYRSSNILLDEFNQFFGGFLPSDKERPSVQEEGAKIFKEKIEEPFEAKFDKNALALYPSAKEPEEKNGSRIQFCLYPDGQNDDDFYLSEKDAKALFIAKKILSLHESLGVAFKDIALLVKSRTNYSNIARIFTLNKIPFSLDEQGNIFTAATANDFYNILRLCVYPSDINAFASFLNSPFAGMTLNQTEKILSLFPKKAFDPNIDVGGLLSKEEAERYQSARGFYKDMADYALSNPIVNSIERLWQKEGYKFSPNADEEHYDLLYELARKADMDARDLSWFVDQLAVERNDSCNESSEINIKDCDYPVEKTDSVNVMTIHKSKGLQFRYVFVWGLAEKRGGNNPDRSKIFQSGDFGAVVANGSKKQNLFALLASSDNAKKEDAETRRLIYVAFTRAIDGLFVIGNEPPKAQSDRPLVGIIQAYARMDSIESPYETETIAFAPRGSERNAQTDAARSPEKIRELYQKAGTLAAPQAKNIWTSPSQLEESGQEDEASGRVQAASMAYPEINSFVNSGGLEKNDYGTLFHAFMEGWARERGNWTSEKISAKEYFEWEPKAQKLSLENQETLLRTFFKILDKFLSLKENPAVDALKSGRDFKAEYKFKTKIKSFIVRGTMDAIFQNSDGSWTVLDYKTDLRERPQIYYAQLACYKKTAADLFTSGDTSKISCQLFFAESGRLADISQEAQKSLESLSDEKIRNLIEKQEIL